MKLLIFLFLLILIPISSALQITEVESNPPGTDTGNEWMEIYSSEEINLTGYVFINNDGEELIINRIIEGYFVYTFPNQWLDNSDEKISIYKEGKLIDETPIIEDTTNDENTFSFCEKWIFQKGTKGEENCEKIIPEKTIPKETKLQEKNLSFPTKTKVIPEKTIIDLNPKTIKTQDSISKVQGPEIMKYSFGIFCILLGFLYAIKPRKRKNEWRSKNNSDDGD